MITITTTEKSGPLSANWSTRVHHCRSMQVQVLASVLEEREPCRVLINCTSGLAIDFEIELDLATLRQMMSRVDQLAEQCQPPAVTP